MVTGLAAGAEASSITVDSHQDGDVVQPGIVRLHGTYTSAYNLRIAINGSTLVRVHQQDTGTESGTWHYDLDASQYDGTIEIVVIGSDSVSRYGTWSPFVTLHVDNPDANIPVVTIVSPKDGAEVPHRSVVRISAEGKLPIRTVEVRINGGAWQKAQKRGPHYDFLWDTRKLGPRTNSIEARAVDAKGNVGYSLTTYAKTKGGYNEQVTLVSQDRAVWIWEPESYSLVLNPGARTVLQSLAKDTTFGQDPITTLYLATGRFGGSDMLEDERASLRDFIRWAHREGYRVEALIAGGTLPPYFGAYERYHDTAIREFEKVLNYNLSSEPIERFDGVNVDIEPYIAVDFKTDKPSLQIQYLEVLEKIMQRRDAAGLNLAVGPAIPRWYDTSENATDIPWKGVTKPLHQHVQDIVDYIAIMDYRDQAEGSVGIIPQAQNELDYANAIQKPNSVVIGVEMKDIADSGDPEMITFYEEGRTVMEAELDKVYAAFRDHPAFAGVALHHYEELGKLPSQWGPDAVWWQPPSDASPPSAVSFGPVASAFDFQTIDISYDKAYDNIEVDEYRIYRGTTPDFPADEAHLAGTSRGLSFTDTGLLPETTYYYKVTAVDVSGNEGPVSGTASAVTGSTSLKPMIVSEMNIVYDQSRGIVTLTVADLESGQILPVTVHGRFTYMGGRYVDIPADEQGIITASSELIESASGRVGFQPKRITFPGYYWASAHDQVKSAVVEWGAE